MTEEMHRMSRSERRMEAWKERSIMLARDGWQISLMGIHDFCKKAALYGSFSNINDYLTGTKTTDLPASITVVSPIRLRCNGWEIEYDETKQKRVRVSKTE